MAACQNQNSKLNQNKNHPNLIWNMSLSSLSALVKNDFHSGKFAFCELYFSAKIIIVVVNDIQYCNPSPRIKQNVSI